MGICRDSRHKRRNTGGKRTSIKKKRKYEMGRPMAATKLGEKRIHKVRGRGNNLKFRAMRLDSGNFSWGSEVCTRKTRILDVVYNSSNNELVRTKTIVKNCIVQIDATPFKAYYKTHYGINLGGRGSITEDPANPTKLSNSVTKKQKKRVHSEAELKPEIEEQLKNGRILAAISSRPGQSGRADGYILEGAEYEFYKRKMRKGPK